MTKRLPRKLVKVGDNRYKTLTAKQAARVKLKEGPTATHKGGRPKGKRQPVPKHLQKSGVCYCTQCTRQLNVSNRSGLCKVCAPHVKLEE